MLSARTKEPQYDDCLAVKDAVGLDALGLMCNWTWNADPKRLAFVLARYKFVSKMLQGKKNVLEVGCGDAFGTRIVQQAVGHVTAIDFDPLFVQDIQSRSNPQWPVDIRLHDILKGPVEGSFDGAYSLDVLEHIEPSDEKTYLANIIGSLTDHGVLILGMPSLESQQYASPASKAGHVNCKSGPEFKKLLEPLFHNVFMFSMNDEVVHTGYSAMAHYLIAMCCAKRS